MNRLPNIKIREIRVLKAIENGDSSTLNLLLQAGACPNYDKGPYDVTPLHVAISKGGRFCDRFVEMLLRAKAGRNSQKSVDNKNI
jgi:ankyrin repeat protein